ncbi:glycine--tRNA ligase subunit beta [Colwellia sp. 1_MG-2023]|jgi:glycyl-tRNA synthetase beta chain|uniref:glycine--tRNA ligase subunit beta n=1 Tax=unclassified Colwellia TaxID=196834 RepID=UPI001C095EE9|nr:MULTISPECIES: glycine--tRNA ligase subunit beta [unclassified Colwellia]MBU2923507.1 glycine--tRNA ligase subunit beta [Colwellia sp. C2M11]MDO6486080.1 glycine--tRNA ligase subunit beta [Colwellia sp. 6_MG-2023]MDO6653319.1 glycine--tRNA ligase subunit beta [Colwellia sp. 3_MG-2023]MDO6664436.1 glycine--tRNA ligase subunit beta [Colwellia sp. 2_MG-2023]MDO6688787.1 glycine--tRNA ligase subunit beta [Colwellia sp. 1_MG-2023]
MTTETLLIELGTEELPPKALKTLATAFFDSIKSQLDSHDLAYNDIKWFATPRRMAVQVFDLVDKQQDKTVEKRGPAVNVAFDEAGNASKAAQGWAKSNGITVEQAERLVTDKGEWLLHTATVTGLATTELIPDMVNIALKKLPIAKPMRWGAERTQFIRPVHTLTMLFGSELIAGEALGVTSGNQVQGHRFHHQGLVTINHANDYQAELAKAYVEVDFAERQNKIVEQIKQAANNIDAVALIDEDLLNEVTALVEWPVTLVGTFDKEFLNVPAEPLIYSMKDHQKYFPVTDKNGQLVNKFIFVSNIESKDPEAVIFGNEKVIRPRLADAEFFFKTDKKQSLESRLTSLESVLFQKQLGTLKAKSERIAQLSQFIAQQLNENADDAYRAGLLSKTDLMSEMVLEFPQVQGTMGKYYALHDGENENIAQALEDQYRPRFSGDSLPEANIGCAVAISDKIDTLVGIFGIKQAPKGDKDPFALRRAAIGSIRIIIEKQLNLDLSELINKSIELFGDKLINENTANDVLDFIMGRFRAFYQEQGISVDVIQAVLAKKPSAPLDFDKRIKAVTFFGDLPEAATLAAANKRVGNILAKFDGELYQAFNVDLATEQAERDLADVYQAISLKVAPLMADKNYQAALSELAQLKAPIDTFFDNVMVMSDDEAIKTNRLTLLNEIRNSFFAIADISLL